MNTTILLLSTFAWMGCGVTYQLGEDPPDKRAEEELAAMIGEKCTLTMSGAAVREVRLIAVQRDSMLVEGSEDRIREAIPTDQIQSISRKTPALLGGLAGAVVGGVVGAAIGGSVNDLRESRDVNESNVWSVVGAVIGGGVMGRLGWELFRTETAVRFTPLRPLRIPSRSDLPPSPP